MIFFKDGSYSAASPSAAAMLPKGSHSCETRHLPSLPYNGPVAQATFVVYRLMMQIEMHTRLKMNAF